MLKITTEEQRQHIEMLIAGDAPDNLVAWRRVFSGPFRTGAQYIDSLDFDGRIYLDTLAEIVDYLRACNPEKK